ncbi:hypothetical protein KIL84_016581 [Mauremys mutica]|uniref:Uncharacterized protein n=1 Tax=Mauremys mutica TaxID=74926 RepID=A0A9D3X4Q4_9SAUR|nr:hypothetical protein KIL84_016581 [Mauremys mutica]
MHFVPRRVRFCHKGLFTRKFTQQDILLSLDTVFKPHWSLKCWRRAMSSGGTYIISWDFPVQSELNHFFGNVRTSSHTEVTTCKRQKKKSKKEEQKTTDEQN